MSYKALAVNFFFCSIICYGQQLDNAGFEQWENVGSSDEEPIEWSSTKTLIIAPKCTCSTSY